MKEREQVKLSGTDDGLTKSGASRTDRFFLAFGRTGSLANNRKRELFCTVATRH